MSFNLHFILPIHLTSSSSPHPKILSNLQVGYHNTIHRSYLSHYRDLRWNTRWHQKELFRMQRHCYPNLDRGNHHLPSVLEARRDMYTKVQDYQLWRLPVQGRDRLCNRSINHQPCWSLLRLAAFAASLSKQRTLQIRMHWSSFQITQSYHKTSIRLS